MLVLRGSLPERPAENLILAAADWHRNAHAVRRASLLSKQMKASLLAIQASSTGTGAEELAAIRHLPDELRLHAWGDVEVHTGNGCLAQMAIGLAQEGNSSLIVTDLPTTRTLTERLLGTDAQRLIKRSAVPTLGVRNQAQRDYRCLLIATSLGGASISKVRAAARLFPAAKLVLVNSYHPAFESFLGSEATASFIREQRSASLRHLVSRLPNQTRRRVQQAVVEGDFPKAIFDHAHAIGADLLVVGKRRRTALSGLFGSKALDVAATASSDVLLIPETGG